MYNLAFSESRYVLPSQLTTTAKKMYKIGDNQAALYYLRQRLEIEKDFYEDTATSQYTELSDTFQLRANQYNYNLSLKEQIETIFERGQYYRMLWNYAAKTFPKDTERNNQLAHRSQYTDSLNLAIVGDIISQNGYPSKTEVGEFANQAVWQMFQHADLDFQKRYLPQIEQAASRGDIAPLLDSASYNQWRKKVGLPPIEQN